MSSFALGPTGADRRRMSLLRGCSITGRWSARRPLTRYFVVDRRANRGFLTTLLGKTSHTCAIRRTTITPFGYPATFADDAAWPPTNLLSPTVPIHPNRSSYMAQRLNHTGLPSCHQGTPNADQPPRTKMPSSTRACKRFARMGTPILLTLPQVSSVCALYAQSYVIRTPFLWAQVFTRYIDPSIRSRRSGPGGRRRGAGAVIIGCCSDPVFKDARRASVLPAVGLPQAGASVAGSRERNPGIVPLPQAGASVAAGKGTRESSRRACVAGHR